MDHLAICKTFADLNAAWMRNADSWIAHCRAFGEQMRSAGEAVSEHFCATPPKASNDSSEAVLKCVNDLAWSSRHYHQVLTKWLTDYVVLVPELDEVTRQRALFWVRQIINMLAPANFFWTNPQAVLRLIESKGESLLKGLRSWSKDAQQGDGLPKLTDPSAFSIGKNLAATPGQVVFRNQLVEVIQYAPQTEAVWRVPIVLIQPWINKYYIFDLGTQNSFVQYLVRQGFTVFITSWSNPTRDLAHISFEDYMLYGALQTIQVAREICRCEKVHAAGYCIGGTLLAALLGWLTLDEKDQPIADATFFATLLDFKEPGDLRALVNPTSIKAVEQLVASEGVLHGSHLALAFRLLNSGDLIWRNMVNNYYYGETPPRSDMLFWNSDSTSLPGAMCTFYLKAFYMENRLIHPNALVLDQRPIDLKRVRLPLYVVGAAKDHICPWQATFQTCRLTSGPVRYILSGEGHITGIVDPPSRWSKKKYWAGTATRRRDANRWIQGKQHITGSWWPDWVSWLKSRSGAQIAPPPMGSGTYPPMGAAPGTYVLSVLKN